MPESLKKKTVKGVAWTSLNMVANIGFSFIIGVILARLLSPSDYGLLAMIAVFNSIAVAFMDCGFGSALMELICKWADQNRITLTLTPSVSFGATSTKRLVDFYKRFGFVLNKGKQSNFKTRQAMYRIPE